MHGGKAELLDNIILNGKFWATMGIEFSDVSKAFAQARAVGDFDTAELVAVDWLSGPRTKADRYLVYYSTAVLAHACGLNSKAVEYANRILEEFPNDTGARQVKSDSLFLMGQFLDAEEVIRECLEIAKTEDQLNIYVMNTLLGKILNAQGKPQDAEAVLTSSESDLESNELRVIARHRALSETYQLLGDVQKARHYLLLGLRSIAIMPNSHAKYLLQGEWLDDLSKLAE